MQRPERTFVSYSCGLLGCVLILTACLVFTLNTIFLASTNTGLVRNKGSFEMDKTLRIFQM
jgi:hypothetical protein